MLKKHRFWAWIMVLSAIMCLWTGHQLIRPKKDNSD